MAETKIGWTNKTWNPTTGCTHTSPGCKHCYAERVHARMSAMGLLKYSQPFSIVRHHDDNLMVPLYWRKPSMIFVNSMSDLFHKDVPDGFIDRVFAVMALCHQHTFQVLTKRADRMAEYFSDGCRDSTIKGNAQTIYNERTGEDPPFWLAVPIPLPNVWLGVSAENQKYADDRIPRLLRTPAAVRFVSVEPMLEAVNLRQRLPVPTIGGVEMEPWLDWVICGGESGPQARPMQADWVRSLRDQCAAAKVPFFFKQWGEFCDVDQLPADVCQAVDAAGVVPGRLIRVGKHAAGNLLDGVKHEQFPEAI